MHWAKISENIHVHIQYSLVRYAQSAFFEKCGVFAIYAIDLSLSLAAPPSKIGVSITSNIDLLVQEELASM
jgi:hypothetical protein